MFSLPYGAPRQATCEELKVRTVRRGQHGKVKHMRRFIKETPRFFISVELKFIFRNRWAVKMHINLYICGCSK